MQIAKFLGCFAVLGIIFAAAQDRRKDPNTERIVDKKHGFSVVRPHMWYVYTGGDTPVFFTFAPKDMPSDGGVPPGGASIWMHASDARQTSAAEALSGWAAKIVAARHGSDAKERSVNGPGSNALEVTFEQLPLGTPGNALKTVVIVWLVRDTVFGAELTFVKGDPRAAEYERVLLDFIRSFRLI